MRNGSTNLDLLRSVAVLLVVASHLPIVLLSMAPSYHVGSMGLIGVLIFFVHTCLVLMMSLERQSERDGTRHRALHFFVRRAFRIYPLSIVTVLVLAGVTYATAGEFSARTLWTNLLLIQNLTGDDSMPGALWSLPYEVQMYLLLPILYGALLRFPRHSHVWIAGLWLVAVVSVLGLWVLGMNYHIIKYVPCFLPGVLAFALRGSERRLSPWWLACYVAAVVLVVPVAVGLGARENILAWPVCLGLGVLIPVCAEVKAVVVGRLAKLVAQYSFGIYLVHGPLINFAFHSLQAPAIAQWAVFLLGTAGLSYVAYQLIERPFVALGSRLSRPRRDALKAAPGLEPV
jgi:peptidoglycan/LPS O-acetylase OafA/YrhL